MKLFILICFISSSVTSYYLFNKNAIKLPMVDIKKIMCIEKKIQKKIAKSQITCLKNYEKVLHIFHGRIDTSDRKVNSVTPVYYKEKSFLRRKNSILLTETLLHKNNELLGLYYRGKLYRNCDFGVDKPYSDLEKLLEYVSKQDLNYVFHLTEIDLGTYCAFKPDGNIMFFKKVGNQFSEIPKPF